MVGWRSCASTLCVINDKLHISEWFCKKLFVYSITTTLLHPELHIRNQVRRESNQNLEQHRTRTVRVTVQHAIRYTTLLLPIPSAIFLLIVISVGPYHSPCKCSSQSDCRRAEWKFSMQPFRNMQPAKR